jgi:radical SAM protein with 4Fe4S-binding SPASM domain
MIDWRIYNRKTLKYYLIKGLFWSSLKLLNFQIVMKGQEHMIPMWSRLMIELHSDCNRDCTFCPRYNDYSGIRKDKNGNHVKKQMPTWKIKDIIDQVVKLGYHGSIGFHRLSEPFLDNRYIEVGTYAKEKGLIIRDHTNGDILKKNPDFIKQIDNLVDFLTIGLYDYKNKKEKYEQMKFWRAQFNKTKIGFSLAAEYPLNRINSELETDDINSNLNKNFPCLWPMWGLWIRYDGELSLCCEDDQCRFGIGNVFDKSIKDLWLSKKHIEIVNTLKKNNGRLNFELCKKCYYLGNISNYKEFNEKTMEIT